MNPLEHQLIYPFADRLPGLAERIRVAPGIEWLRLPLPFALDHINVYLLRDRLDGQDGWTLVDTGVGGEKVAAIWERVFRDELDGLPIVRVLCTHMHPDHVGQADAITRRFEAPLWMTQGEFMQARVAILASAELMGESQVAHFRRHGITGDEQLEAFRQRGRGHYKSLVPGMPARFHRLRADEPVRIGERDFQVIVGTGHSPEHASLYCADGDPVLLSGDMVLPRISTNVSVWDIEPEANPLEWYLRSLQAFEACAPETLVLPSHGRPFKQLHVRLVQQHEHHAERLAMVLDACRGTARNGVDITERMFNRRFNTHELSFALGEALAHLHALWYRGDLERRLDPDGVFRFLAVS